MKKGRVRFENRGLLILLGVLCVVIVGILIGIVVINVGTRDNKADLNSEIQGNEGGEEYKYAYVYDGARAIMDDDETKSLSDLMEYFDVLDSEANNNEEAVRYKVARMDMMCEYGFYQEMIDWANSVFIENEQMSTLEYIDIYTFYSLAYGEIDDIERKIEYEKKLDSFIEKYNEEQKNG